MKLLLLLAALGWSEEFSLVSWNVQTFGRVGADRLRRCAEAYAAVISTDVWVLAVQEIANERGSRLFMEQLPEGAWLSSFRDTSDPMDNAHYFRGDKVSSARHGFVFDDLGTGRPDRSKMLHPARWAEVRAGDFDFTLVSVHLTYARGDEAKTERELRFLLEWMEKRLADPAADPDLIVAGDFNLSAEKLEAALAPGSKLRVLVREYTSRGKHSYDHFLISEDVLEELVDASAGPYDIPPVSDHYPIIGRFRSKGQGVRPDLRIVSSTKAAATARASTGR